MNILNPKKAVNVNFLFTKVKYVNFVKIMVMTVFFISCSKTPKSNAFPNYDGIYLGDFFQNGPNGFNNFKHENINCKVFDNKLQTNLDISAFNSSFTEDKIVRINLSGSNFSILPDTTDIVNVLRVISGNGSFKNQELTLEWREIHIYSHGKIDTLNFKGNFKR